MAGIIGAPGDLPDVLRGRDIAARLQGIDLHPHVLQVLVELGERTHVVTKGMAELATMFDQMVDSMQGMMVVAENMKTRTDRLVQDTSQDQEHVDDNTRQ